MSVTTTFFGVRSLKIIDFFYHGYYNLFTNFKSIFRDIYSVNSLLAFKRHERNL